MQNVKPYSWNTELSMVMERVSGRKYAMEELATAFARTGNQDVAEELRLHALVLDECYESLKTLSNVISDQLLAQAKENSRNVLNATLAGIDIGGREKKTGVGSGTDEHVGRGLLPPQEG